MGRIARKKPYVDKTNRMKRIQYVESSLCASEIKCYGLMKVNLTCLGLMEGLWFDEIPQEAFDLRCTVPIVKHGGGKVKCWGSFSSSGVGNLVFIDRNMTEEVYRDILQRICKKN